MTAHCLAVACLVSLLLVSPVSLASQVPSSTLTGIVLDPNHEPLPRVTVRLLDAAGAELARTLTNNRGAFRFANLAAGAYRLAAELVGFEAAAADARPGQSVELTLRLAPVREQVVVTATRTPAPSAQLGSSVTVLTAEELEARRTLTTADALRAVPGAAVARSGGLGATTSLFIRGGESDHNKIFLDGIPLNEPGGSFDFTNLTAENLDRIEIVRGPQSALFGSDAMASVVQLFTRRGQAESPRPRWWLAAEGGNLATWRARGGVTGEVRRLDYSLAWARLATDNREPNSTFQNTSVSANLGLALDNRTSLRFILRGELGRAGTPGQTAFGRPDRDAFLRRRDADLGLTLRHQTTSAWEQRLTYAFAQSRQVSRNLIEDPPFVPAFQGRTAPFAFFDFTFDFLNHTRRHFLSYQSDWRARFGSAGHAAAGQPRPWRGQQLVTFAFEWDREQGASGDRLFDVVTALPRRDNFGWVGEWQILWPRFYLTLGGRFEKNDRFGFAAVPRVSAAALLRHGGAALGATKLKFNFGLGIKEPSLLESFGSGPFIVGNPSLVPERTRSFELGVEQRFARDRGKLELNAFDNRFRDLIGFEIVSFFPFTGSFFNVGQTRARGSEIIFELAPGGGLRARGSYTLLDSRITRSGTVFDPVFEVGNRLFRRPRHSGAFEIFWDWKRLTLASTALFVGRRTDSDFALLGLTSNRGYTRWDLGAAYRSPHRLTYFGGVENLLNRDYMEVLGYRALPLTVRAGACAEF